MMIIKQRRCILILILLLAVISNPSKSSADSRTEAIVKYNAAIEAWNDKNYGLALYNFEESNRLYAYPDFHYNAAACYDLLGNYDEALSHFQTYLNFNPQGQRVNFARNRIYEIIYAPTVKKWQPVNAMMDGPTEYGWVNVKQPAATTFYLYPQDWIY